MKYAGFFRNAAVLSLGALLAKGIGALYRIPLANLLGGYGEGLYHMAYPLFCLMLTLSSAGVPAAVARAVAAERAAGRAGEVLPAALRLFAPLGAFAAALMGLCALPVAHLQGDGALAGCYLALAPAVLPVALIAVLRGWRQGRGEMGCAALSSLVEQLVKAGAGLLLASRFSDPARAAQAALFAVTLSEGAALLFLGVRARERRTMLPVRRRGEGSALLFAALPVMANAALMPLSQMLDSVLVVRLLARRTARAVHEYGLLAGSASSLIALPVTLCSGPVASAVPSVAACMARGEEEEGRRRALIALAASLSVALPCAAGLIAFAPLAVRLLYPALGAQDAALLVRLVRTLAFSALSLCAVETLSACLTAMGQAGRAARAMALALALKTLLQCLLVPMRGITGAAIASGTCYPVAFFLDLFYTVRKKREMRHAEHHRTGNKKGRTDGRGARGAAGSGRRVRAHRDPPLGGRLEGGGDRV